MPTSVKIDVILDDKGVVKTNQAIVNSFNQVEATAQKTGKQISQVENAYTRLAKAQMEAKGTQQVVKDMMAGFQSGEIPKTSRAMNDYAVALQESRKATSDLDQISRKLTPSLEDTRQRVSMLGGMFGVQLPEQLSRSIARLQVIPGLMAGAFNVLLVSALIPVLGEVADSIKRGAEEMAGWTANEKELYAYAVRANTEQRKFLDDLEIRKLKLNEIGLQGVGLSKQQIANDDAELKIFEKRMEAAQKAQQAADNALHGTHPKEVTQANQGGVTTYTVQEANTAGKSDEEIKRLTANLEAADQEVQKLQQRITDLKSVIKPTNEKTLAKQLADDAREAAKKLQETRELIDKTVGKSRSDLDKSLEDYHKQQATWADRELDRQLKAEEEKNNQIIEKAKILLGADADLQRARAEAVGNGVAAILAEEEKRKQETIVKLRELGATEAEIDQYRAIMAETAADKAAKAEADHMRRVQDEHQRMVDRMTNELERYADAIGRGNLGQVILSGFKHLFISIIAEWITKMREARKATEDGFSASSSGGGGILSTILGGLFGRRSSGSAGTSGSEIPSTDWITPSIINSAFTPGALVFNPTTGQIEAGAGMSSQSAARASSGGIFAALGGRIKGGLPGILGSGAVLAGQKFGGFAGMIGAGIGAYGISLASKAAAMGMGWGAMTPAISGLFAGATGGLVGFGIGMNTGKLGGILSGAGSGVLTGALMGGPIGAVIGGVIGAIGGLFGGILGGQKRRRQANAFASQIDAQIDQITKGYETFQIEYQSAFNQLEQIRSDSWKQLQQLKGEGKDVFWKNVGPHIDAAEKEIRGYQTERDRRARFIGQIGLPQFHEGGEVLPNLWGFRTGPGEQLAVLKHHEFVMNERATAQNRPTLEAMNKGVAPIGSVTINGPLIQAGSVDDAWLRNGGANKIILALRRAALEGNSL